MDAYFSDIAGYGFRLTEEMAVKLGKPKEDSLFKWFFDVFIEDEFFYKIFPKESFRKEADMARSFKIYIGLIRIEGEHLTENLFSKIKAQEKAVTTALSKYGIKPEYAFFQGLCMQ